ncbi:hypothetical protein BC793_116116 [Actinoplanes xinjiangensis]|uniref:Uncharacterized protein n=1 Tax=Actinoplanes xinjiangensis TaxID=512350 RepID=A0A316F9S0_9ACTN|nr:hypothetical protein BC793_116116 [Actinoplanes xinjiangensis]
MDGRPTGTVAGRDPVAAGRRQAAGRGWASAVPAAGEAGCRQDRGSGVPAGPGKRGAGRTGKARCRQRRESGVPVAGGVLPHPARHRHRLDAAASGNSGCGVPHRTPTDGVTGPTLTSRIGVGGHPVHTAQTQEHRQSGGHVDGRRRGSSGGATGWEKAAEGVRGRRRLRRPTRSNPVPGRSVDGGGRYPTPAARPGGRRQERSNPRSGQGRTATGNRKPASYGPPTAEGGRRPQSCGRHKGGKQRATGVR